MRFQLDVAVCAPGRTKLALVVKQGCLFQPRREGFPPPPPPVLILILKRELLVRILATKIARNKVLELGERRTCGDVPCEAKPLPPVIDASFIEVPPRSFQLRPETICCCNLQTPSDSAMGT